MDTKERSAEPMEHERFRVKEGVVFAVLASDNQVGQIKEISRGGLTFQCVNNGKPVDNPARVDIFSPVHGFYLEDVPVNSIADVAGEGKPALSSVPMRELSIQFGNLTPSQRMLLDFFLKKYAQ